MRNPLTSVIYLLSIYFFGPFDLFKFGNFVRHGPGINEKKPSARFISFDSNDGKIDIELDLAVPFISVPLNNKETKDTNRRPAPLLTVNTKGIAVLGILLVTSAFIVPLFIKPHPQDHHYRMDQELQWWNVGHAVNDVLLRNRYVTPCVQRVLCSLVTTVKNAENPTSTEKIIDGVVSHKWFENFANGSVIMDAITKGQGTEKDCVIAYKGCPITQKIIDNALRVLSIV